MSLNKFDVIRRPISTEKAHMAQVQDTYVFEVHDDANKFQIKQAVEGIWNVKVKQVRITNTKGEQKRNKFRKFRTTGIKKAYVRLQPGYEMEIY